jgi:dCTP deaminase
MILSQPDIRKAVRKREIVFSPELEETQWGEASVDLRLGFQFTKLHEVKGVTLSIADGLGSIADLGIWDTKELRAADELGKPESYELSPREFVLALTYESIQVPRNLIARIEGRSTYARMGLSMHQTAPWIQPGWSGPIVLEIANHGALPIKLTPVIDRPCQLTFFKLTTPLPGTMAYGSRATDRYKNQTHPIDQRGAKGKGKK